MERSFFILTVDTKLPIELSDFVGQLVGIGHQFERFIALKHPELAGDAKFYVQEIRHGSFVVEILPVLQPLVEHIQHLQIVDTFLTTWAERARTYFTRGGRDSTANKSDLRDVLNTMKAIARDPDASAKLELVAHEDNRRETRTIFKFRTEDANTAVQELEAHIFEIESREAANHSRVSMVFSRPDSQGAKVGTRSGERVIIESIDSKPRPLIYASELAEQRIKSELLESETNLFRLTFIVDVNVELKNKKPWAYRVTHVHQVIADEE